MKTGFAKAVQKPGTSTDSPSAPATGTETTLSYSLFSQNPQTRTYVPSAPMIKTSVFGPGIKPPSAQNTGRFACQPPTKLGNVPSLNFACLKHVPGTYDTYTCTDCEITLDGYKLGDKNLSAHIIQDTERDTCCRYLQAVFKNRPFDWYHSQGLLRFQNGQLAYPSEFLHTTKSYTQFGRCVVCSCEENMGHHIACADMRTQLKIVLRNTKLVAKQSGPLLFSQRNVRFTGSWGTFVRGSNVDTIECDGTAGWNCDFGILGDASNMIHQPGTVDAHSCSECGLSVRDFVEGDTLCGEHIYHTSARGMRCPYVERNYTSAYIATTLAGERYRRGMLGWPDQIFDSAHGLHTGSIADMQRCVVCNEARCPPSTPFSASTLVHHKHCNEMSKALDGFLKKAVWKGSA